MRRIGITLSLVGLLLAALALPGGASASHLSRSDFKSASKYCKALRAELGGKAFKKAFRAKRVRGAHRRCVKRGGAVGAQGVRALAPVSIFPVPAAECPPGTQPEEPKPVSAFATPVACVALPPATTPPDADDDDEDGDDDDDDSDDDDDDSDGDDEDDGDSDEEDD